MVALEAQRIIVEVDSNHISVIGATSKAVSTRNELTKSLRQLNGYWRAYCELKEWETVSAFHLELKVTLPKDLSEEV